MNHHLALFASLFRFNYSIEIVIALTSIKYHCVNTMSSGWAPIGYLSEFNADFRAIVILSKEQISPTVQHLMLIVRPCIISRLQAIPAFLFPHCVNIPIEAQEKNRRSKRENHDIAALPHAKRLTKTRQAFKV